MPGPRDSHSDPVAAPRKSVRTPLARLVLIPAAALVALGGTVTGLLVSEAVHLHGESKSVAAAGRSAQDLLVRLQDERRLTATWQAVPRRGTHAELRDARSRTEAAVQEFRTASSGRQSADAAVKGSTEHLHATLKKLSEEREAVDGRRTSRDETFQYYTDAVAEGTQWLRAATRIDDGDLAFSATDLSSVMDLTESLSREDAVVSGVLARGRVSGARAEFDRHLTAKRRTQAALDSQGPAGEEATAYRRITGSAEWARLESHEKALSSGRTTLPQQAAWRETADVVEEDLRQLGSDRLKNFDEAVNDRADNLLLAAVVGSVPALAALVASAVLARRFSHYLTGRLSHLHETTTDLADAKLHQLVDELNQGKRIAASEPKIQEHGHDDELGRLAAAQHHLERTVHAVLLEQARGRDDKETVFLGLARRTQALVNRLIPKLDELERKHQDSDLLKDIFAVDHLATRMRRHNENLMIIGGAPPARRWSKSVPVYEVVRSAISETQEYGRVEAHPTPSLSLVGPAVSDVVHLLAELIENGTAFSPPETKVSVTAVPVAKGLALEVEDRGLGMPDNRYDECNKMLAEPPKLNMAQLGETPRLGLFVVALLAQRRNLQVSLGKSPYGGTRAIVLVPDDWLEETHSLLANIVPQQPQKARTPTAVKPETERAAQPDRAPVAPVVEESSDEFAHSYSSTEGGFPSYGGEGLLPGPGDQPADRSEQYAPSAPDVPSTQSEGISVGGGNATPAGSEIPRDPVTRDEFPSVLPTRVRGEHLAAPLRKEGYALNEQDDDPGLISPERAGAAIGAIQAANTRARPSTPAEATGSDPGRQAEKPVYGAHPEDH